jgi:hypothetical protein
MQDAGSPRTFSSGKRKDKKSHFFGPARLHDCKTARHFNGHGKMNRKLLNL